MHNFIIKADEGLNLETTLTAFFSNKNNPFIPFDPYLMLFCSTLSQELLNDKQYKEFPDFIALGFWLRSSHMHQMQQKFLQKMASNEIRSPRGLIFHICPANIEVMLVYSWISALIVGNRNILRLSTHVSPLSKKLLKLIEDVLSEKKFAQISLMNLFIRYGHEDTITTLISSKADLRVVWGGDNTIEKMRKIPLQAHAVDLAFPDRFSLGIIHAESYLTLNFEDKNSVVTRFYNDIYWFDQLACSSPRFLIWIGESTATLNASTSFYQTLQKIIEQKHYEIALGATLLKKAYMFDQALDLPVEKVWQLSNELSIVYLNNFDDRCRRHCGYGLLYHLSVTDLMDIVPFISHRDQTLVHFGFDLNDLRKLVLRLNGQGLTQIIPFGQALQFNTQWDGHDLLAEFTQSVNIIVD